MKVNIFKQSALCIFATVAIQIQGAGADSEVWGHIHRQKGKFIPQIQTRTLDPNSHWDDFNWISQNAPARDEGTGQLGWSIFDENGITERLALSNDGRWAAIGYSLNDERFELRSAVNGELQFAFNVDYGNSFVDISSDGSISAYSALDSVWLFNRAQGANPVFRFGLRGYGPGPVALTRDAEYLLITGSDPAREVNRAWCFRNRNPQPVWMLEVDAAEASNWVGISIAESERIAVLTSKFRMWVVDIFSGEVIWTDLTYNSEAPAILSRDGRILAVGTLTGRLRVLGWNDDEGIFREYWHYNFTAYSSAWVTAVALTPNGSHVAAGSLDFQRDSYSGRVAVFDVYGQGQPLWMSEPFADEISKVQFSADGGVLAVSSWGDINHNQPDLALYETHSREPFFILNTPGSMSGLGISDNGLRILVGGKSVHNRVFGAGGRVYLINAAYPGGIISGRVVDENDRGIVEAEIAAEENPYQALSDAEGQYSLKVEVQDVRSVNLTAQCRGYLNDIRNNVQVRANRITGNINFTLETSGPPPENLRAGQNLRNVVVLQWNRYNQIQNTPPSPPESLLAADGGRMNIQPPSPDIFSSAMSSPSRDDADEAERILIYRSPRDGGPYRLAGSVEGDETTFTDQSRLLPRNHYYYVISADFGNGESGFSNQVESWVNTDFLNYEADLRDMPNAPRLDGRIENNEWAGAVERDISDAFGYDEADSAGSVTARIGFDDETDYLYVGFNIHCQPRLSNRMGVGVYVDDDGDGEWDYERPGSEGNFWGYWVDNAPVMTFRSLTGPPHNVSPYYQFPNPTLAFGDGRGRVEIEMGIPLGFHIPPEVALYAPDKTIGLGLFTIHRLQDDTPVFDGWWPQDMFSIVSNPFQFGSVHIPATLTVPPQAPSELFVDRDGDDVSVTWTDPTMGIDGADLPGGALAGVQIERNGHSLAVVRPGFQELIDEGVVSGGWYEYRARAYVLEDGEPFLGPYSESQGVYAGRQPQMQLLSQDDGSAEAFYVASFSGEDNRLAARYDLEDFQDTVAVFMVDFLPNAASPIIVYIMNDNNFNPGVQIGGRFQMEPQAANEWHRFHFPGIRQPLIAMDPRVFNGCWVVLQYLPDSPGSPGIGVDRSNASAERNRYYTEEDGWRDFPAGQIMARIWVGRPTASAPEEPEPLPQIFMVGPNFPNPFNAVTLIPLQVPIRGWGWMEVFDSRGVRLRQQSLGLLEPGSHQMTFDGKTLSSGTYLVRFNLSEHSQLIKMNLLK